MKKIIALLAFLIFVIIATVLYQKYTTGKSAKTQSATTQNSPTVTIRNQSFKVYIAKTSKEQQIGLSSRESLPQDYGMLFPFGTADYYQFWMKNMKFPIDILYLKNNKIVTIINNAQPLKKDEPQPTIYRPEEPSDTVLEINAGLSKKYKFQKGDEVKISTGSAQ